MTQIVEMLDPLFLRRVCVGLRLLRQCLDVVFSFNDESTLELRMQGALRLNSVHMSGRVITLHCSMICGKMLKRSLAPWRNTGRIDSGATSGLSKTKMNGCQQ